MPVRVVVRLAPVGDRVPVPPPHTGPAVYYAVLDALRASPAGTSWAAGVHDAPPGYKQLSVTPLLDERDQAQGLSGESVRFEVGVLVDELTAPLLAALRQASVVRIARCRYRVDGLDVLDVAPYAQLLDRADRTAVSWSLRLVTPVAFESTREEGARRLRTLPEPEWVWGSLLARWQHLAGGTRLHAETAEVIGSQLAVTDWSLRRGDHMVLPADASRGRRDPLVWRGSVGSVVYRLVDGGSTSGSVRASLDALARFASFAGVGDRTNVGMGLVRVVSAHRQGDGNA